MEEKRSTTPSIIAAVLLLLPLVYIGSYVALLRPIELDLASSSLSKSPILRQEHYAVDDSYQFVVRVVFYPLHQVDTAIRREYWKYEISVTENIH
jgi:hypothetical protein